MELLVFFGPPASGKDTITNKLPDKYLPYKKAKYGTGNTRGYQMLEHLPKDSDIISCINRYNNKYYILKSDIASYTNTSQSLVIHTTDIDEIRKLKEWGKKESVDVIVIEFINTFNDFLNRSINRGDLDTDQRSKVWFTAYEDSVCHNIMADIVIDTSNNNIGSILNAIENRKSLGGRAPLHGSPVLTPVVDLNIFNDKNSARRYIESLSSIGVDILLGGPTSRGLSRNKAEFEVQKQFWLEYFPPSKLYLVSYGNYLETDDICTQILIPEAADLDSAINMAAMSSDRGLYITDSLEPYLTENVTGALFNVPVIKAGKKLMAKPLWRHLVDNPAVKTISSSAVNMVSELYRGVKCVSAVNLNLSAPSTFATLAELDSHEKQGRQSRQASTSEKRLELLESLLRLR